MSVDLSTISAGLRKARRSAGLSQVQLSRKLGVTQGTISRAEASGDVRVNTLVEIARALDLDVMVVPRRLRSSITMLLDATSTSSNHTAVYTGAGDEPYYEGDADQKSPASP